MTASYPRHYASARQAFLAPAAPVRGQHEIKARGPDGEALTIDWAMAGADDSPTLLVINSGVHGVELFAGSACQSALLQALPPLVRTRLLLVHAVNPWGAAHVRRTNETNIDLCRNFFDPMSPPSPNDDYEALHDLVALAGHPGNEGHEARAGLDRLRAEWGDRRVNEAMLGGQYRYRDGFAFGGYAASESRKVLESLLLREAASARRVVLLDLHTGLGERGAATLVSMQRDAALATTRAWYGSAVVAPAATDDPEFPEVRGHTTPGYERLLAGREVIPVIVEFGTHSHERITRALLADHWAENTGVHPADQALIKDALLEAFSPAEDGWITQVKTAFADLLARTLRGIAELP
ncbi:MAG: DUF2817 domain-containing protein [Pseudomonadales bacterium]|nr:DUF2817 domain-containing protein [Pseudomonadales bacterium]MCP5183565.1 DUF2817 domain-containing protein [Pseudomonadales bacterium]